MAAAPAEIIENLDHAVEAALWEYDPVRDSLSELDTQVDSDGRIEISGHVRSGLIKDGVLETLRRVAGVTIIVESIFADNELEYAVARSLATVKGIAPGAVSVHSHLGAVTLVGNLTDDSSRAAAAEVANQIPGVIAVVDRLSGT